MLEDSEDGNMPPPSALPPPLAGKELRIDDDNNGLGVVALLGAAALVPLLAFGVASTLGFTDNLGFSDDNEGLGKPLTTEEVRGLVNRQAQADESRGKEGTVFSVEEAREEQSLVDVLQGGIQRAR